MSFRIEINPELKMKSDIMFKAFYGRKENEEFLQDFLEAVLEEKIKIKKVMHDVRLEQLAKEQKFGILDLGVELEDGTISIPKVLWPYMGGTEKLVPKK